MTRALARCFVATAVLLAFCLPSVRTSGYAAQPVSVWGEYRGYWISTLRVALRDYPDKNSFCNKILNETIAALRSEEEWTWAKNIRNNELGFHWAPHNGFFFNADEFLNSKGEPPRAGDNNFDRLYRVVLHEARHHTLNHVEDTAENHAIAQRAADECAPRE